MKSLTSGSIHGWVNTDGGFVPRAVGTICPFCFRAVVFALSSHRYDSDRNTVASSAACPACHRDAYFWTVNPSMEFEEAQGASGVYMFPEPDGYHDAKALTSDVPKPLVRAYTSTVDAYNSGNYTATAVCCRRALEGIFKYLLPVDQRALPLAKAIEEVKSTVDLSRPLHNLSHAIRQGGNLGAHFDMQKEPDDEIARSMVQLLEYLIMYLYVLPREIEQLDEKLSRDG